MNLGLVTSFVIGGILLVSILMMNINLSISSQEMTLTQMTGQHTKAIADMVTHDIPKIGYNRSSKTNPKFNVADSNKITFYSNIDNSADGSVEEITWVLTTTPVSATSNPNDYVLKRIQDGVSTDITLGVTQFTINYYDQYGVSESGKMTTPISSSDFDKIKQIEIKLVVQSEQQLKTSVNGSGRYIRSAWEKRFSPPNLEETI